MKTIITGTLCSVLALSGCKIDLSGLSEAIQKNMEFPDKSNQEENNQKQGFNTTKVDTFSAQKILEKLITLHGEKIKKSKSFCFNVSSDAHELSIHNISEDVHNKSFKYKMEFNNSSGKYTLSFGDDEIIQDKIHYFYNEKTKSEKLYFYKDSHKIEIYRTKKIQDVPPHRKTFKKYCDLLSTNRHNPQPMLDHFLDEIKQDVSATNIDDNLQSHIESASSISSLSPIALKNMFLTAVKNNKRAIVECFLKARSTDIDWKDALGNSALHYAVEYGYYDLINILLHYSPCVNLVNNQGETPLMISIRNQSKEIIQLLLKNGANINHVKGTDSISDITGKTKIMKKSGILKFFDFVEIHKDKDHTQTKGTAPDDFLGELFSDVAFNPEGNISKEEIESQSASQLNHETLKKLFFMCIEKGKFRIVQSYIKHRLFDIYAIDKKGNRALHYAAIHRRLSIAQYLLSYECDVNSKNNENETPLCIAVKQGDAKMVSLLLKRGANVYCTGKNKESVFALAEKGGWTAIARLLEKYR